VASLCFVCVALIGDCASSHTLSGTLILLGLIVGAVGDVCLLSASNGTVFHMGVRAFLAGHIFYVVAFFTAGVDLQAALLSLIVLLPVAILVLKWVMPQVPQNMKVSAFLYVVVISVMVLCSVGTHAALGTANSQQLLVAAVLFFISDLCVAQTRFIGRIAWVRASGLYIYYLAQTLFATACHLN